MEKEKVIELLVSAQGGDTESENMLIKYIKDNMMNRRIGKYLSKNRQVENEDLRQEFMIGVALNIHKANLDIGDPIEFLIAQGVYKVRAYLRKHITINTVQLCNNCGNISRLNRINNEYICKKCGSNHQTTQELDDHNEIILENMVENDKFDEHVVSDMIIEEFEKTLDKNTNVYRLFILLRDGINRDNPNVKNYIKEIANIWGGCSNQNVVQNMEKLKRKITDFANNNNFRIENNNFVYIDIK